MLVRMKVIFETIGGTQFEIEVGDFDTLQEMKEKVEKALEIPISKQILSFNGNIIRHDIDLLDVMHGSVINLHVAADPFPFPFPAPAPAPAPAADKMELQLEISPSETITVKTSGGDTIRELKEKIHRKEGTPVDQILITNEDGMELPDHRSLRDCAISLNSGVTVEFLPEPPPRKSRLSVMSSSSSSSSQPPPSPTPAVDADKMSLVLQYLGGRMPMEVRRVNMVSELRMRLETMNFKVPGNGSYFFFHNQTLLDEERSFASQNVAHGDLIHIHSPGHDVS